MNKDAMQYLCELSTHFHLETVEDWDIFFDLIGSIKNTGNTYPSDIMKSALFPKQDLNAIYGSMYAGTDSAVPKMVKELTVLDIMRFTDDAQIVAIYDKDTFNLNDAVYIGEMQKIPNKLIDLKVSCFCSDYVPKYHDIRGSFIVIRIVKN